MAKPRGQWQRLERQCRESLGDAAKKLHGSREFMLEATSITEAENSLLSIRASTPGEEKGDGQSVAKALHPALETVAWFSETVSSASQHALTSSLIWAALLLVVEAAAGPRKTVTANTIEIILDFTDSIPVLQQEEPRIYAFTAVQYAFLDIFEDFMYYCVQTCDFFASHTNGAHDSVKYLRSPRGILEAAQQRMRRHVSRLPDAVAIEEQYRLRQQESRIVNLVSASVENMPSSDEKPKGAHSTVEFPVNTVDKARNNAFVGRVDLLDQMHQYVGATRLSNHYPHSRPAAAVAEIRDRMEGMQFDHDRDDNGSSQSTASTKYYGARKSKTPASILVLSGMGGIGKTELTLEFYYEHRSDYDAAFWTDAEQDWTLASTFAKIADKLELLPTKTTDDGGHEVQNIAVEESRKWLQSTGHRWLLIFDNVEDFNDLARYMPVECRSESTIIVTTQLSDTPQWIGSACTLQVAALNPGTAAECIFKYSSREASSDEEREIACDLAEHVGCLPLAMATIGGYVKVSQSSLSEFFENVKHKATLWETAPRIQEVPGYSKSLVKVFDKAFEALTAPARELLNILAFLDPDCIPEEIFTKAIEDSQLNMIKDKADLVECYFELRNRQMIQRDGNDTEQYISIHRAVQWNVLLHLSKDYDYRWQCFIQAFNIVKAMLPNVDPKIVPEPEIWPPYARHGRQILELRSHCLWPDPPVQLPLSFAQILADMGAYIWFSGKFPQGEKALDTAEAILDDNNAKFSHSLRAHIYQILGIITSFEGVSQRAKSMELRKNAASARNQNIGRRREADRSYDEDNMLWSVRSDLAFGYIQEEDWDRTTEYIEECYEHYKTWDKDEWKIPFEYSKYYQLMAFCHMADQKPVKAIEFITRCHDLMQKAAGAEHPMALLIRFCEGILLWHTKGDRARQKVLEINKAVLQSRRQQLGEFSHFTLESYSTCGKLCYDAGEISNARQFLATCLQRRRRAVWNDEGVTRAQYRYANVLHALASEAAASGDASKSQSYADEAKQLHKAVEETVQRYRRDYSEYMPLNEDIESNLDQMVSIWAGRFSGGLRQVDVDLSVLDKAVSKVQAVVAEGSEL